MAEVISIPSPSVFLTPDSPPAPPASAPTAPADDQNRDHRDDNDDDNDDSDDSDAAATIRSPPPPPPRRKVHQPNAKKKPDGPVQSRTASRKSALTGGAAADGSLAVKPKQTKSRNGCVTCKIKRLKCDETKPGCKQCEKRKVECGGYRKEYKWCPFEETAVKHAVDRQKQASTSASSSLPRQGTTDVTKPANPADERPAKDRKLTDRRRNSRDGHDEEPQLLNGQQIELVQRSKPLPGRLPPPANRAVFAPPPSKSATALTPVVPGDQHQARLPSPSDPVSPENSGTKSPPADDVLLGLASADLPNQSPTLTEILMPFAENLDQVADMDDLDLPDELQLPMAEFPVVSTDALLPDTLSSAELVGSNIGAYPTITPVSHDSLQLPQQLGEPASAYSSLSMSDPGKPLDDRTGALAPMPSTFLFNQPTFDAASDEMLSVQFDRYTCGILSVMDGPTENPWRNLIWPLAKSSPALRHAIFAMTAYHSCMNSKSMRMLADYHKGTSISHIREGIQFGNMSIECAIATTLALGFSESWDQHTVTGNFHIKGAQALVKRAIANHQADPRTGKALARLKFLCNAWVYMDVIARLTSVDSDDSEDFDNMLLFSSDPPPIVMGGPRPSGFGIDFGMPVDARLDPLMGCANTLFPIIGRVANLVRRVCRTLNNSPTMIEQANELKLALETWDPPEFIEPPEDPTAQLQHALQTAEAYRWATLLHLQQAVPELPSPSDEELCREVLNRLATVPLASRLVIVQIYPLMVAGCLADDEEDRNWVRKRWSAMRQRMWIGVIDKCAVVTEEVWRRRDTYRRTPKEHRKIIRTSDLHPIRRSGAPLKRSREDYAEDVDAGSSGVVYSWIDDPDGGRTKNHGRLPSDTFLGRRPGSDESYAPYSVRGHLHWVGVMWDWGWEILLG